MRHLLRDDDLTAGEQTQILDLADAYRADRLHQTPLAGPRSVAVLFDKASTRTRVSFTVGIAELGGLPVVLDRATTHQGRGESVTDTARVLHTMVSAIVWRTFAQSGLEEMAAVSAVPVVNALSDDFHPCQLLADLQTVRRHKGRLAGLTVAYLGDGANNMAHSYLLAGATAGMHVRIGSPDGYAPDPQILDDAVQIATGTAGSVRVTTDAREAVTGADVVATDTWVSMGQEDEYAQRVEIFRPYAVDTDLMSHAAEDAIVLHCLPAYRGLEIAADVIDGPQSVVWDEAENRLHAQKALLTWLLDPGREEDR